MIEITYNFAFPYEIIKIAETVILGKPLPEHHRRRIWIGTQRKIDTLCSSIPQSTVDFCKKHEIVVDRVLSEGFIMSCDGNIFPDDPMHNEFCRVLGLANSLKDVDRWTYATKGSPAFTTLRIARAFYVEPDSIKQCCQSRVDSLNEIVLNHANNVGTRKSPKVLRIDLS